MGKKFLAACWKKNQENPVYARHNVDAAQLSDDVHVVNEVARKLVARYISFAFWETNCCSSSSVRFEFFSSQGSQMTIVLSSTSS